MLENLSSVLGWKLSALVGYLLGLKLVKLFLSKDYFWEVLKTLFYLSLPWKQISTVHAKLFVSF